METKMYKRDVENAQQSAASADATNLIKNAHAGRRELLRKLASVGETPLLDVNKKPLSEQAPKLQQSKLPDQVGHHGEANITPLSSIADMKAKSDQELARIVESSIEELPANPVSSDYSRFADGKAARTEQFRRSMNPTSASARPFVTGPTTTA